MKSNHCGEIQDLENKISLDGTPGTAIIRDHDRIDFELVTENLDGVFLRNKRFKVTPIQERTPEKAPPSGQQPGSPTPAPAPSQPSSSAPSSQGQSSPSKVSPSNSNSNKDDQKSNPRTPVKSTVQQIMAWFAEKKIGQGSKNYTRVTASGKKILSQKKLRMSSDEDSLSPPSAKREKKRSKKSSFKH